MIETGGGCSRSASRRWARGRRRNFVAFANALHAQAYFTADPGSYPAGLRAPFSGLVASTKNEKLVAPMATEPETQAEKVPADEALLWGRERELASVAHEGASWLIVEELVADFNRSRFDE